jgi:hypothetical protein
MVESGNVMWLGHLRYKHTLLALITCTIFFHDRRLRPESFGLVEVTKQLLEDFAKGPRTLFSANSEAKT